MRTAAFTCKICGEDAVPGSKLGYCAKCQKALDAVEEARKKQEEERLLKKGRRKA